MTTALSFFSDPLVACREPGAAATAVVLPAAPSPRRVLLRFYSSARGQLGQSSRESPSTFQATASSPPAATIGRQAPPAQPAPSAPPAAPPRTAGWVKFVREIPGSLGPKFFWTDSCCTEKKRLERIFTTLESDYVYDLDSVAPDLRGWRCSLAALRARRAAEGDGGVREGHGDGLHQQEGRRAHPARAGGPEAQGAEGGCGGGRGGGGGGGGGGGLGR